MIILVLIIGLFFKSTNSAPCVPVNECVNRKQVDCVGILGVCKDVDTSNSIRFECDNDGNKWLVHYTGIDCKDSTLSSLTPKYPLTGVLPDAFFSCTPDSCSSYVKWRSYSDTGDDACSGWENENYIEYLLPVGCYGQYGFSLTAYGVAAGKTSHRYSCTSDSITTTDYTSTYNCTGPIADNGQNTYNEGCNSGVYSKTLYCAANTYHMVLSSAILFISFIVFM